MAINEYHETKDVVKSACVFLSPIVIYIATMIYAGLEITYNEYVHIALMVADCPELEDIFERCLHDDNYISHANKWTIQSAYKSYKQVSRSQKVARKIQDM